jgi:hypothetical protein
LVTYFIPEELVDTSTPNVAADEEVTNYTSSVDLINAKVSGEQRKLRYWFP